jgi:cytochrome c
LFTAPEMLKADPIHDAAEEGNVFLIKELLDEGVDVNAPDLDGTPLQWALFSNQVDAARTLLKFGADPNVEGWDGTILESASLNGKIEVVQLLLAHGANPNLGTRTTPLIRAIQKESLEIVEMLLEHGADPALLSEEGIAPLHEVAKNGELEVARILIDRGADVNVLTRYRQPPIHFAIVHQHLELAAYLKKRGAVPGEVAPIMDLLGTADLMKGEQITKKECTSCHILDKAQSKIGPPLWNVVGRRRGNVSEFIYSPAFQEIGGEWTFETLNEYLARPAEYIPGNTMAVSFPGIPDPQTRANVIAYLRTLSDNPVALP